MKTAVEFLEKGMEESGLLLDHKWLVDLIEQAKAMEKAEKDKQYQRGFKDGSNHIKIIYNL